MSNPLDPIWQAYESSIHALKVVRRCSTLSTIDEDRPFRNTRFHGLSSDTCKDLLDEAQQQIADQAVLALYAAFEATLRDHVTQQSALLHVHATRPDQEFGQGLASLYESWCREVRMDEVARLFANAAGKELVDKAGTIRSYRHWVAHGCRGASPSTITPQFAYDTLSDFLRECGMT